MSGSILSPWEKAFGGFPQVQPDDRLEQLIEAMNRKNQAPSPPPIPLPPPPDPFVYASQVATMQPKDRAWRLFQGVLFRIADVRGIVPKAAFPNEKEMIIVVRFTDNVIHEFALPAFTKDDPTMWFSQHVLGMEFEFTPKP